MSTFFYAAAKCYGVAGIAVALVLAGWELIDRLRGYPGLRLRQYPMMMLFVIVTWPWSVYALGRVMRKHAAEDADEQELIPA